MAKGKKKRAPEVSHVGNDCNHQYEDVYCNHCDTEKVRCILCGREEDPESEELDTLLNLCIERGTLKAELSRSEEKEQIASRAFAEEHEKLNEALATIERVRGLLEWQPRRSFEQQGFEWEQGYGCALREVSEAINHKTGEGEK